MNIYVGNISHSANEEDLRQAFAAFGDVATTSIIKDKFTGASRGFGFVEMPSQDQGTAAIAGLNGKEIKGRPVTVNEARPKTEGGGGGGGGNFRGGPRRGGGGGGGGGGDFRRDGGNRRSW